MTKTLLAVLVGTFCSLPPQAYAGDYIVHVNTASLAGSSGFLAFDLVSGLAGNSNTVRASAFSTNSSLGVGSGSGSFSGTLAAGTLVLSSTTNFFNSWLQPLIFGTEIRFELGLGENYVSGAPDNFSFYLLNSSGLPFSTTDPSGSGAALGANLVGNVLPNVFQSPSYQLIVSEVPEPRAIWLLAAGLLGLAVRRGLRSP